VLEKTRTAVCSEQAADHIRGQVPLDPTRVDVEVILADRRLEMLRDLLFQLDGDRP